MKVILDIPEESLKKLGEMAKSQKRSRKAFMEFILISTVSKPEKLESKINYQQPTEESYDGSKLSFLTQDEVGLTAAPKEEDIPNWKKAYNEYLKTKNNKK